MSGKISNFGGHKAAPFKKGGKRRAKVLVAKAAVKKSKRGNKDFATPAGSGYVPAPYDANGEGAGEPVTCPKCGKGDARDARYCDQCGFKLVGALGVRVKG